MLAFSEGSLLAERDGIERPDETRFDIGLAHKDIQLARRAGDQLGTPLPSAAVADETLSTPQELGYEQRNIAALDDRSRNIPAETGDARRPA